MSWRTPDLPGEVKAIRRNKDTMLTPTSAILSDSEDLLRCSFFNHSNAPEYSLYEIV